jgi:hypothetical protein
MPVKTRNPKRRRHAQKVRGVAEKLKAVGMNKRLKDRLAHLDEY